MKTRLPKLTWNEACRQHDEGHTLARKNWPKGWTPGALPRPKARP